MIKIHIESINDSNVFSIDIKPSDTINTLKKKINEIVSIPQQSQILCYDGNVLRNNTKLNNYGIQTGSTITLLIKSSQKKPNMKLSNGFAKHQNTTQIPNSQKFDTEPFMKTMTIFLFIISIISFVLKLFV